MRRVDRHEADVGALDSAGRNLAEYGDGDRHRLLGGEAMKRGRGPPADIGGIDHRGGEREDIVLAEVLGAVFRRKKHVSAADETRKPSLAQEVADDLARGGLGTEDVDDLGRADDFAVLFPEGQDDFRFVGAERA